MALALLLSYGIDVENNEKKIKESLNASLKRMDPTKLAKFSERMSTMVRTANDVATQEILRRKYGVGEDVVRKPETPPLATPPLTTPAIPELKKLSDEAKEQELRGEQWGDLLGKKSYELSAPAKQEPIPIARPPAAPPPPPRGNSVARGGPRNRGSRGRKPRGGKRTTYRDKKHM